MTRLSATAMQVATISYASNLRIEFRFQAKGFIWRLLPLSRNTYTNFMLLHSSMEESATDCRGYVLSMGLGTMPRSFSILMAIESKQSSIDPNNVVAARLPNTK